MRRQMWLHSRSMSPGGSRRAAGDPGYLLHIHAATYRVNVDIPISPSSYIIVYSLSNVNPPLDPAEFMGWSLRSTSRRGARCGPGCRRKPHGWGQVEAVKQPWIAAYAAMTSAWARWGAGDAAGRATTRVALTRGAAGRFGFRPRIGALNVALDSRPVSGYGTCFRGNDGPGAVCVWCGDHGYSGEQA